MKWIERQMGDLVRSGVLEQPGAAVSVDLDPVSRAAFFAGWEARGERTEQTVTEMLRGEQPNEPVE